MKESLSGILGEGTANIALFILAFAAILVAIFIVYAIIKRISGSPVDAVQYHSDRHDPSSRLAVVDAAMVDDQRKLVLVRRDDVEHLILIGGPTDVVVEQNITPDNDYARSSRITEAQIARYQDKHQANDASDFAPDFAQERNSPSPARAINRMPDSPLALSSVPEAARAPQFSAPQFNTPEPKPEQVRAPLREPMEKVAAPVAPAAPSFTRPVPSSAPAPAPASAQQATPAVAPAVKPVAPQPRTVMPAAPMPNTKPATRSHPAYPLSQVSQGVLTSTSGAAATAAATAAAASNGGRLDNVTPQKAASLDEIKPEPVSDLNLSASPDDFASLDDALGQALFNDLNSDFFASDKSASTKAEDDMAFILEEELLSSLDMEGDAEADFSVDIEDEMEKLLGELSINPER